MISTDLKSNFCAVWAIKTIYYVFDGREEPSFYLGFYNDGVFMASPNVESIDYTLSRGWQRMMDIINKYANITNMPQIRKVNRNKTIVMLKEQGKVSLNKIAHELNMHVSQVHKIYHRDKDIYKKELMLRKR